MKRQKFRTLINLLMLLLFPVTMNYLSPYISASGAAEGIVSGSLLVFALFLVFSMFLGRLWCGWMCPSGALNETCARINDRRVGRIDWIRFVVWGVWFAVIVALFISAGGVHAVNPLLMTESGISIDAPFRYVIYYSVLALFLILNLAIGRRGACHVVCWMSPFMNVGRRIGRLLRLPQLHLAAEPKACVHCGTCTKECPMSIDVEKQAQTGRIVDGECILCGVCADRCPKQVFRFRLARIGRQR